MDDKLESSLLISEIKIMRERLEFYSTKFELTEDLPSLDIETLKQIRSHLRDLLRTVGSR